MIRSLFAKLARRVPPVTPDFTDHVAQLRPSGKARGVALQCYAMPSTLRPVPKPLDNRHTVAWESLAMIQALVELGYEVDAISYKNKSFTPSKHYDVFVGVVEPFGRLAKALPQDCLKILHINYSHWLANNLGQYQRLHALQQRRGITLQPVKLVQPHPGIELADCATCLGNEFTMGTYAFSGKPIYRVPISTNGTFPPLVRDYEQCRRNFVWFGSKGFVHKGLDLVLDTFAQLPEFTLTVCGPIGDEPEFEHAYRRELYETPNIRTAGWMDVASKEFIEVLRNSVAVVFPSCAEGGGGSAIISMHGGLIPIVTREASVDVRPDYGVVLPDASVGAIAAAVQAIARLPATTLLAMSERARFRLRAAHPRAFREKLS